MIETLEKFNEYLLLEKDGGIQPESADAYLRHIEYLYEEQGDDILKACKAYPDVARLIRSLKAKRKGKGGRDGWTSNMAAKTAYMATVFFTWAAREGLIENNPMQFGHEFKKGKSPRPDFFEPESEDLAKTYSYPHNSLQDVMIFKLFYASGIRRSELCALDIKDIDFEERTAFIKEGKGGEHRYAYFDEETSRNLEIHVEGIKAHYPLIQALFVNEQGRRLNPHALTKYMIRRGRKIGVKMNPHKYRHSVGGRIIENGGDIKLVADILGHKSLSSTNIYTHFKKETTRKMYDQFNKSKVEIEAPSELLG